MASKTNNLNVDIFCALKVSEVSKVPTLLLGNPGIGKTVSVYKFGEIRGYDLVLLRGNSSTPEEIMGYDVAPRDVTYEKPMAAIHLRPSWFEEILRNHEAGRKTLLFLDEITTANEFVQAALLHLIFERKVGSESLPDDTLIVSAGNYAGNLSNTMALLPPVMNRFMIYNITADHNDLDIFLNRYEGAIADTDGKCNDYMVDLTTILEKMDKQERKVDEGMRNKIGEYIERSIKDTTRMLIVTTKDIDLTVTDMKTIYSDTDDDAKLCGFVSFRTLNYLRDVAISWYLCFGKAGISSKNFRNAVDGLCGIGITRPKGASDVVIKHVGKSYYDALCATANELEKLNNDKLPEYTKYFVNMTNKKTTLEMEEFNALVNKIQELQRDQDLKSIDKPIDPNVIADMCHQAEQTVSKCCTVKVSTTEHLSTKYSETAVVDMVVRFNTIVKFLNTLYALVSDADRHYDSSTESDITKAMDKAKNQGFKIQAVKKILVSENPGFGAAIPNLEKLAKS